MSRVRTAETSNEPRQPSWLEKKTNTALSYPCRGRTIGASWDLPTRTCGHPDASGRSTDQRDLLDPRLWSKRRDSLTFGGNAGARVGEWSAISPA